MLRACLAISAGLSSGDSSSGASMRPPILSGMNSREKFSSTSSRRDTESSSPSQSRLLDHEILDFECAELARGFERFVFHVLLITQQVSLLDRETYLARPKLCQDRISRVEPDSPVFEDRHFPPSSQQPLLKRLRRLRLIQQALRSLDYLR